MELSFQLAIAPLVGALAPGNTIVLKPSELTPSVSKMLKRMLDELFPEELVAVVEGGVEESTSLLREPFDYIFFTGSVGVGKVVMEAAETVDTAHFRTWREKSLYCT